MYLRDEHMTDEDRQEIIALCQTIDVLAELFHENEGTTEGLRMASAAFRHGADVLDRVADRAEKSSV